MGKSPTVNEAMAKAEEALSIAKAVGDHVGTIARGVEAMRGENTSQHAENGRKLEAGFEAMRSDLKDVHGRLSTVKSTQDTNRAFNAEKFTEIEAKLVANASAADGAKKTAERVSGKWDKVQNWMLVFLILLVLGLVFDRIGFKFSLPGTGG